MLSFAVSLPLSPITKQSGNGLMSVSIVGDRTQPLQLYSEAALPLPFIAKQSSECIA